MPGDSADDVAGIVLAAGTSSRMGHNKLLIDLDGEPVVRRATRNAADAGLDPLLVILGFEADLVRRGLEGIAYEEILNPDYDRGINRSVQLGIQQVQGRVAAAVVILADMPFVTVEMIAAVAERYRRSKPPLVISQYGGVRAPPTLYDHTLFSEFSESDGEGCGRRVVRRHRDEAAVLEWPADALTDLDRPDDVERVRNVLAGRAG